MGNSDSYIHRFARTLAGQLGIRMERYGQKQSAEAVAQAIADSFWKDVHAALGRESAETFGKLAASGQARTISNTDRVALCDVHRDQKWLDQAWSGHDMLRQVAATAVIAAMADNFWGSYKANIRLYEEITGRPADVFSHIEPLAEHRHPFRT